MTSTDCSARAGASAVPGVTAAGEAGNDGAKVPIADREDPVAAFIYTSGTTAEPKAAVLRHRHLLAYVLNTVEFGRRPGSATRRWSRCRRTTSPGWPAC